MVQGGGRLSVPQGDGAADGQIQSRARSSTIWLLSVPESPSPLSGFGIWLMKDNATVMLLSHLVHNVAFVIFVIAVPVHIYLGTLANPGTLKIMMSGTLPLDEAKKRYPKWMKAVGKM